LVRVEGPEGVWEYEYDALGNRVATTINGQRTEFLVDPSGYGNVIGEYEADGDLIRGYVHALGLASQVAMGGETYFYAFDGLGSASQLTDTTGAVVNQYAFAPFGELVSSSGRSPTRSSLWDASASGPKEWPALQRARFYDARDGRFTTEDPIGLNGRDVNLSVRV
jgi:YD repeat-containing protein